MLCHSQKKRSQVAAGVSSSSACGCTAGLVPAGEQDGPQGCRTGRRGAGELCCVPDATTGWGPCAGSTGPPGILPAPVPGKQQEERCTKGTGLLRELCKCQTAERFSQHIQPLLLAHSIMLKRPFFISKEFKKTHFSLYSRRFQVYLHSPSSFSLFCHYCF